MQFLVVLSLCAGLALWIRISIPSVDTSIKVDGVYLGMTRAELEIDLILRSTGGRKFPTMPTTELPASLGRLWKLETSTSPRISMMRTRFGGLKPLLESPTW